MVTKDDGFESIFNKAKDTKNRFQDWEFVMAFCDRVNEEPEGSLGAMKVITNKLRVSDEGTQLLALAVLEACVKNCGVKFHNEVGKFKLLNELIKLISPKYSAESSSDQLKAKIRSLMFQWRRGLPKQTKIQDAYEMLKKEGLIDDEGNVPEAPSDPVEEVPRDSIISDEKEVEALENLLKSRNPRDLARANQMIQDRYKKENLKIEISQHRSRELELVENNAKLLDELLGHYSVSSSQAEVDLILELRKSCVAMKEKLQKIAEQSTEDEILLSKVCASSDALVRVLEKYDALSANVKEQQKTLTKEIPPLISSPPAPPIQNNTASSYGMESLLDLDLTTTPTPITANSTHNTNSNLQLLLEDFGPFNSVPVSNTVPIQPSAAPAEMLLPMSDPIPTIPMFTPKIEDPTPKIIAPSPNLVLQQVIDPSPKIIEPSLQVNTSLPSNITPGSSLDSIEVKTLQVCPIPAIIPYTKDNIVLTVSSALLPSAPPNIPDVKAAVITLINLSPFGVENFSLHVASAEDMKLKLYPPSQVSLLPYTPFQSPPITSNVLVIQTSVEVLLKLISSFSIGGRQVTEIIDVSGLKWV